MGNKKQVEAAQKALSDWLSETDRMGKAPSKIECTMDFEMDGLTYYVFKYKKKTLGPWYIGICGGFEGDSLEHCGHIFSGMEDLYEEKTALDLAKKMAMFIRDYNERGKIREMMDAKFKQNIQYIQSKELDAGKIAGQFVRTNSRFFLTVGTVDVPSGKVVVADPLAYMSGEHVIAPVLAKQIPAGSYPAEVAIYRDELIGIRMCTARLKIKETAAVRYELAESEEETAAAKFKDGIMHGFPVDAGIMCFIDANGAANYNEFIEKWHKDNPGKNHYDDYFKEFFAESDKKLPQYQREGGDFIEWTNPDTNERMVQIASGLGDGFYHSFWGYDEGGDICELIVPMVDPDIFEVDS